jgi:8-oxo-dGTP pyrophosphatase MutT (NUDIX family)
MDPRQRWKTIASRYLYQSRWFSLRQDDVSLGSEDIVYTFVEHPGYAMVVPLLDDGRVLLEKVYRYTVKEVILECPSGGLDGDPPEFAARRELREETGWVAERLELLGSFYGSHGISNERFFVYLATGLRDTGKVQREPTEDIELVFLPFDEAVAMATDGRIANAPTCLSLLLAARAVGQGELRKP